MVTIESAAKYSTKAGEMAYQIVYSDGTEVRSVESVGNIIRIEAKKNGEWIQCGKPYVVNHNRKRQGERIKANVEKFIAA